VETVYIEYNFNHFLIYLPKLLKLMEIWQSSDRNNFAQFFLRHGVDASLYNMLLFWFNTVGLGCVSQN